jgi:glycosyltransferase involved in cell wall biosynthesis
MPRFGDGGGERVWLNILERLDRARWQPSLAFFEKTDSHFFAEIPADVRVHDFGKRRRASLELPRMVAQLAGALRTERPAAVVSMLHTWGFILEAAQLVSGRRVPVIVNEHIHVSSSLTHLQAQRPLLSRVAPILHRVAYRRAARIVAISTTQAAELEANYGVAPNRLVVIPNGIDRARIEELSTRPLDDAWLAEGPYVLAIGRLIPQKGLDDLVRAYADIAPGIEERLAIAGEGELRSQLERLIEELGLDRRVRLLGRLDNPFPALAGAQAFVMSSRWEALPQVLMEALALGAPVVSTDCPTGPREILGDGRYGVLVPPGDRSALGAGVRDLLSDAALRQTLSTVGPQRAAAYDVDEMVRRYEAELASVTG